ncbi:MAG: hypothetical protein JO127_00585 [Caulobacteraceae bacterium]|nr:hypothetical protein [Caulobacteraceae bacterium]
MTKFAYPALQPSKHSHSPMRPAARPGRRFASMVFGAGMVGLLAFVSWLFVTPPL